MFRNYLSAALRNLARNRIYSAISITGLAIGIATAIFAGLFIRYELSYDRYFPDHENIYRVSMRFSTGANDRLYFRIPEWLKLDIPEIQMISRLDGNWVSVRRGTVEIHDQILYADPDFFKLFPFKVIAGSLDHTLRDQSGAVLTRRYARKLFGEDAPIGKTFEVLRQHVLRVDAVIEDTPANTHMNLSIVAPMRFASAPVPQMEAVEAQPPRGFNNRLSAANYAYIRLKPGASPTEIERRATAAVRRHLTRQVTEDLRLELIPLADIHLRTPAGIPLKPSTDPRVIVAMGVVGILIVVIAALNFINLTTARAAQRSIEVGIRKSCGAGQRDLIVQFLGESVLYVALATLLAMALVELFLPAFNWLIDRSLAKYSAPNIPFHYWRDPSLALALISGILVIGIAAGAYPALVLARFKAASVLRGGPLQTGSFNWRQAFVVLQFTILIVLILVTTVVERQMHFVINEGLRIDRQQVLLVFFRDPQIRERFQTALTADPGVLAVTSSFTAPTNFGMRELPIVRPGARETTLNFSPVDRNFFRFYGLPLLAGRDFSGAQSAGSIIINESALRRLGLSKPQDAIGQTLRSPLLPQSFTIIGVVPDFPTGSANFPMENAAYLVHQDSLIMISARLKGADIPETLGRIDQLWRTIGEPRAIARQFLDEYYDYVYSGSRQQAKIFATFSAVAVSIACLGLFGLSVFSAQRRTKEIGIRKAMGAGRGDVLRLLLWQFTQPVLIAAVIATPLGAYLISRWLEGFVIRVSLQPWLLLAPGAAALVIALLTVGAHCYAVASAKPVTALRYE